MSGKSDSLSVTPLNSQHRALGALMAPFGGWEMPIQYEGIIAEHRWCREQAALFDICHMGEFLFKGDIPASGLEELFTFSVAAIPVGRSKYGFLLNEQGGIIDDLIVFRFAEQEAMIVVNAATAPHDFQVIRSRLHGGSLVNISAATAKLDLQGPESRGVLTTICGDQIAQLPYFRFVALDLLGVPAVVSRTGYTGELGYEIFLPAAKVAELWQLLLADPRVKPAGLGARDLLRLEVGYSLYSSDLDQQTTPLEAGLEAFVNFDKNFVGKAALLQQQAAGVARRKIAFTVNSRRAPRHGYQIQADGRTIGEVTSGVFSPMLGCGIGLGYVESAHAALGTALTVCQERVSLEATVCSLPFYSGGSLRN
ncbi:glycine cleavage system aminomethyltransferase GcvT [Trichlorobacter sp.]|uniref:glycine cleavage system aminomethyltransferase GcvT n=1 Tax=Trichlorobacter sp. TaxID=2911007 RepID=UPI002A35AEF6|nr:glycine cleavage system aminomethyltransferase GcvT [Trichlorobacter sp.]MDY0385377.1 glycine cleavage system aminomethyltransferase GcvT [Trichlorobacter sp.]